MGRAGFSTVSFGKAEPEAYGARGRLEVLGTGERQAVERSQRYSGEATHRAIAEQESLTLWQKGAETGEEKEGRLRQLRTPRCRQHKQKLALRYELCIM